MARKSVAPCIGDEMVVRRILMEAREVVFFKGIVEAHEGLAAVFAERGGELTLAAPDSRGAELDAILLELSREIRFVRLSG
ncbi:MAG TPA: hypothetical protein VGM06_22880 [Polyangiaceae bacterium]|jgi:hypothetical protein